MQDIAPLPGGIETQHLASQPEGNETQNFTSLQETGLEEEGELPEISLSDLLAAMPSPDPGESKLEPGIEWITSDEEDGTAGDFLFPWEKAIPAAETPAEQAPAAVATPPEESVAISSEPLTSPDSPVEKTTPTEPEPAQATAITPAEGALASTPTQAIPDEAIAAGETQLNAVTAVPAATVALVAPSEPPPADDSTKKIIRTAPGATFPMVSSNMALTQRVATPWTQVPLPPPPPAPEPWNQADELESASGDFATLTYTCVMLPRLPDIKLSGRLVNKLAEKLQQICLAYGWRLVSQLIRPDTFQWTVQVAAIVSPGSVARVVRQQTSQFIFDQFDQFSDKLMSGDFWAPGYLIISGSQPPDTRLIGEYIRQTRKRQGIRL